MIRTALIEGVAWSLLWIIYHDYWLHFKGFLIGSVYTTILSLAIAGIDYAILHYVF